MEENNSNETTDKELISKISFVNSSYYSIPEKQTTQSKSEKRPKQTFLQRRHTDD